MIMEPTPGAVNPAGLFYHLTLKSRNKKVGPIPVSTSSELTCPSTCPFAGGNGCYAKSGPLAIHWKAVTEGQRGLRFPQFVEEVKKLPEGQLWRFAQAGDLPGEGDDISVTEMSQLVDANGHRPVIAYTHKPLTETNIEVLKAASQGGFHVNISTQSFEEADSVVEQGFSAVVVLPTTYQKEATETQSDYRKRLKTLPNVTKAGHKIAVCPATYTDTNCLECHACSQPRPHDVVIGFPAHGAKRRTIDRRLFTDVGTDSLEQKDEQL